MNIDTNFATHQRGVILIFSLVMLTLLTLVTVSMVQQNKQELAMMANTLEQTKSLARAESDLAIAQTKIDEARVRPADLKCNSTISSQIDKNDTIPNMVNGTATVTGVYCLTGNLETECTYTSAGARDTIAACTCYKGTEIYIVKWESDASASNYGAQRTVESKYGVNCAGGQF
jgi:Tfp pilus assembly protein PilX